MSEPSRIANTIVRCTVCGVATPVYVRPCRKKPETCSPACRNKLTVARRDTTNFVRGADHPAWRGDLASARAGRARALHLFPKIGPCESCGAAKSERHHKDENTLNNSPENIEILCRRCHMKRDGRLERVREMAKTQQPRAVAARWPK